MPRPGPWAHPGSPSFSALSAVTSQNPTRSAPSRPGPRKVWMWPRMGEPVPEPLGPPTKGGGWTLSSGLRPAVLPAWFRRTRISRDIFHGRRPRHLPRGLVRSRRCSTQRGKWRSANLQHFPEQPAEQGLQRGFTCITRSLGLSESPSKARVHPSGIRCQRGGGGRRTLMPQRCGKLLDRACQAKPTSPLRPSSDQRHTRQENEGLYPRTTVLTAALTQQANVGEDTRGTARD